MKTKFASWSAVAALLVAMAGCSTPQPVVVHPPLAPPIVPLAFGNTNAEPIADRSRATPQEIVDNANAVWIARKPDGAAYLHSSRLMRSVLEQGKFASPEEEMRLSAMAIQHALLAGDSETLRMAVQHWERGYDGIRRAPVAGEVESYLIALRRLGRDLPDDLVRVSHPEIQPLLKSDS